MHAQISQTPDPQDMALIANPAAPYTVREDALLRVSRIYQSVSYGQKNRPDAEAALELCATVIARRMRDVDNLPQLVQVAQRAALAVNPAYDNQEIWDVLMDVAAARPLPRVARRHIYLRQRGSLEYSSNYAAHALGFLMSQPTDVPVGGVDSVADVIELVKKKGVPKTTRHNLSRYVVGSFLNRHGLDGNGRAVVHAPPAVALVPDGDGTYTLAPDVVCMPGAVSGYYYHIIGYMDENKDVICNSGCQFGAPASIIDFWRDGGMSQDRSDNGVPALLKVLAALRRQQAPATRGRYKVDMALVDTAKMLRRTEPYVYRKNRALIPSELHPFIEKKTRKQRASMWRRLKTRYAPGGYGGACAPL